MYKKRKGYVPEDAYISTTTCRARNTSRWVAQLRGLPARLSARRIGGLLQLLMLHDDRHAAISGYSKGIRQKLPIAAALLHNPRFGSAGRTLFPAGCWFITAGFYDWNSDEAWQ